MHTLTKIVYLTILVLFSTFIHAQQKVTYQVAYPDSQIVQVARGWLLENEPKTVLETVSNTILSNIEKAAFPGATLAVNHVGKTHYYTTNEGITSWLGFSELSQNYLFTSGSFNSFYDYEVKDSLAGNFGKFGYYKKSTHLSTGILQVGTKEYSNIQNVETIEIITEHSPSRVTKIRRCNSFYTNNSQLPLLEYVYDTLRTDNSERMIEFLIYNKDVISRIDAPKEGSFSIFPNPFDDVFTMYNSSGKEGIARIMRISGEEILSKDINTPNTTFEVPGLVPGIYLLEFRTNETAQSIKLLKR